LFYRSLMFAEGAEHFTPPDEIIAKGVANQQVQIGRAAGRERV